MSMTDDEASLIGRAKAGDRRAFRQLMETHYAMIYRVAYKFSGHAEDAADIAQEVCLKLVDRLDSYQGDSSFTTWLYRVTVNAYNDFCRRQRTRRKSQESYLEYEAADIAERREASGRIAWLYRAVAALEPPFKETALLVLSEGLSHLEASKVLGCAESTVSWRMHEARKLLKEKAEADHGG